MINNFIASLLEWLGYRAFLSYFFPFFLHGHALRDCYFQQNVFSRELNSTERDGKGKYISRPSLGSIPTLGNSSSSHGLLSTFAVLPFPSFDGYQGEYKAD